ncbi:MAG TPA: alkaline phosphatase family protein [Vicinamibacterales bacterium]|nr:alkaline phosphatase family protein [Vicinamibacterales bacterium]
MLRLLAAGLALTVALGAQTQTPTPAPTPPPSPRPANAPRLLVVLILDQFRADYIEMYGRQWTKGLRRLVDQGAVFTQAAYPYAATYTCAGHATIATGAYPAVHGMAGNDFYDRTLRRLVPCAFDPAVTSVPFGGGPGKERHSGRNLLIPSFPEELRRQTSTPTRIVSIAQKPRSSITFAGRGHADTVAVFEEDDGTWATSDAFTPAPWPDVDEFVRAHPIKAAYGAIWQLLLPASAYRFADNAPGESRVAPSTQVFPHPINSTKGVPDNEFVTAWEKSPLDDEFLTNLAIHLLKSRRLGTGTSTDVLTLSLPSLDHNGHDYGPRSHEVQDILARADVNIGRLIDAIDEQVGPRYTIGFSSDHGVALLPEQATADGLDAGRISTTEIRNAVDAALEKFLGTPRPHVAAVYDSQVALVPGLNDILRQRPNGFKTVKDAILSVKGLAAVYSADEIVHGADSTDARIKAWRLSYVAGRSGDFVMTPKPNWILRTVSGSTHGTLNPYDQRVPLIFFGMRIKPGKYDAPASPADLAPTLMELAGAKLPRAQGRPLTDAIVR